MKPLKEGVIGRKLVDYFVHIEGICPVKAECLATVGKDQVQYRITFDGSPSGEDESVSDWLVTFEGRGSSTVVSAEKFNEVI